MNRAMILIVLWILSVSSHGSEYTSYGKIELLRIGTNGDAVLIHEDQSKNPQQCNRFEEYRVARSLDYYQEIYTMLLAAYMNQARIKLYISGCEIGYPRIIAASLERG